MQFLVVKLVIINCSCGESGRVKVQLLELVITCVIADHEVRGSDIEIGDSCNCREFIVELGLVIAEC